MRGLSEVLTSDALFVYGTWERERGGGCFSERFESGLLAGVTEL